MRPVIKLVLYGYAAAGLCGCVPLTIASALGMVVGGPDGSSPQGTNSPAFRESQWLKDKGPELYQATEAALLEECTARIKPPAPASAAAETTAATERAADPPSRGNACVHRETCLPGNRVPVRLLVCGPADRPPVQTHDGAGGTVSVANWVWEEEARGGPPPGEE